jgi:hypothetical protein
LGTRGFITFVIDGQEKTAYCHCDSYPEKAGLAVLRWARAGTEERELLAARARALRVVSPDSKPPVGETRELKRFAEGPGKPGTWYHLLRGTQGEPGLMLLAGVIPDAGEFPRSPQARWGYVIDIDAGCFEVYEGGQMKPHERGRFAGLGRLTLEHLDFWPPALVASWPFGALPANMAKFMAACYGPEHAR